MRGLSWVLALLILGASSSIQATEQLPPADEGPRDTSFMEFRTKLMAALDKRDVEFLRSIIDPEIAATAPSDSGAKAFFARWQPERSDSELWPLLKSVMAMGGAYVRSDDGVQFCAPYVFTHFPPNLDVTGHAVVVQKGVALKRAPSNSAADQPIPEYAILKVKDWRSVPDQGGNRAVTWLKVSAPDGFDAFARHDWVRGPNDYHACFIGDDTRWRLAAFAAVR